jgi:hypothetical protein
MNDFNLKLDTVDKMSAINSIKTVKMHESALAAERLCAGYWVGFSTTDNNQDPIKMTASLCKESSN